MTSSRSVIGSRLNPVSIVMSKKNVRLFGGIPSVMLLFAFLLQSASLQAAETPLVTGVEWQPLRAQVRRLMEATDYLGFPFSNSEKERIESAMKATDPETGSRQLQEVLDQRCLYVVHINPEMRVKVARGEAAPNLVQNGWTQFLVKVNNMAGVTAALKASSPNAGRLHNAPADSIADRWLEIQTYDAQPLTKTLSGLELEYRIIQMYSRDAGKREARMGFNVGQGTQDIGFRNEVDVLFQCSPAREIVLSVKDEEGKPTTGMFEIRDRFGRVYPSQAKRLAPDFAFHPQVYRADGETLSLPAGTYSVKFARGPESIPSTHEIEITEQTRDLHFSVKRWIDPSLFGYWSGDHHIHAAGCAVTCPEHAPLGLDPCNAHNRLHGCDDPHSNTRTTKGQSNA